VRGRADRAIVDTGSGDGRVRSLPRLRLGAALLAFGLSASAAWAEPRGPGFFAADLSGSHLAGGRERTGYSRAMAEYRLWLEQPRRPAGDGGPLWPSEYGDVRWTWLAEDGGVIRRLDDGRFAVTNGDCVSSLCLELFCFNAGWPMFACDDGSTRKMSAPDFSTVIFDGITFSRASAAAQ